LGELETTVAAVFGASVSFRDLALLEIQERAFFVLEIICFVAVEVALAVVDALITFLTVFAGTGILISSFPAPLIATPFSSALSILFMTAVLAVEAPDLIPDQAFLRRPFDSNGD